MNLSSVKVSGAGGTCTRTTRWSTRALCPPIIMFALVSTHAAAIEFQKPLTFDNRLDTRVELFDSRGQTLLGNILDLAYEYHLPMGIHYLDREAVRQRLNLQFRGRSVREILSALVARVPQYHVSFTGGIVRLYSPDARNDPSNLLNASIENFQVSEMDPQAVSATVFESLVQKMAPKTSIVESTALGTLGSSRMTLHLRNARVYEILDAVVAKHGAALWTVRVPPERLSTLKGALWYIYPLDPQWKNGVAGDLMSLFPVKQSE